MAYTGFDIFLFHFLGFWFLFWFLDQNSGNNIFSICLFFPPIKIEYRIRRESILAICICWLFEFQDKHKFTVFLNLSFAKCQELELYCEAICNFLPLGSSGLWTILLLILFIILSQVNGDKACFVCNKSNHFKLNSLESVLTLFSVTDIKYLDLHSLKSAFWRS